MIHHCRPRRSVGHLGFALVTALAGIIVIGVIIGGVFFMSTQEVRVASGTLAQERAFRAAELGLNTAVAKWDNAGMAALSPGAVVVQSYDAPSKGYLDTVRITKLTATSYSLVSTALAGVGTAAQARKSTGMGVRVGFADFDFLGALTVRGSTRIGGSSYITGYDSNPTSWTDCPAGSDTLPGIAIPNLADLTTSGCNDWSCVDGDPDVLQTAEANDTTNYFVFGDFDWASLTAMATKVYTGTQTLTGLQPSLNVDGSCKTSDPLNWGEPVHIVPPHPCESYFPVIHAKGTANVLHINGFRGQGILLVDGDLEITGGFEFYGPVIVRGRVKTTGTGGKINGGVMAANVDLEQNTVLGDATIKFSSCVIAKAVAAAAYPRRLVHRAWVDVF